MPKRSRTTAQRTQAKLRRAIAATGQLPPGIYRTTVLTPIKDDRTGEIYSKAMPVLLYVDNEGRTLVEKVSANKDMREYRSTEPIQGYPDWWRISSHPVLINRNTSVSNNTKKIMFMLARPDYV